MLKIHLSKNLGSGGATACIANEHEDEIYVAGGRTVSPKRACLNAAKRLREAAARFELLAKEGKPFHEDTHRKINARHLVVPHRMDPFERSYDLRAKQILAFNTCKGDLDDKLDAVHRELAAVTAPQGEQA
ncbi:MAG: hypothetical protein HYU78_09595 [Rhodocyclales bacterium]|nr:hypothetical protein [Rhodocyclales bacterium]